LRPKPILPEAGEAFSGVLVVLTVAVTLFCLAVQFCLAGQPRVDFAMLFTAEFLLQTGLRARRTPVSLPQSKATTHHTVELRGGRPPNGAP
jgi:hypothetical protein